MNKGFAAIAIGSAMMLAACGGDDGGNVGQQPDLPPTFSVTDIDVSVTENTTGPVTTVTIDDEDLPVVQVRLEGADGNQFRIDTLGRIFFLQPPDFENPTDTDGNNVYTFTIVAVDGVGNVARLNARVTVTDDATAARYMDTLFGGSEVLANTTMQTDAGGVPVAFHGPTGDMLTTRAMMVVGGDGPASRALADELARRGYVVAATPSLVPEQLLGLARGLQAGGWDALGVDTARIGVTMPGDARASAMMGAAFTGSDIPVHVFAPDRTSARDVAAQFYGRLHAAAR